MKIRRVIAWGAEDGAGVSLYFRVYPVGCPVGKYSARNSSAYEYSRGERKLYGTNVPTSRLCSSLYEYSLSPLPIGEVWVVTTDGGVY